MPETSLADYLAQAQQGLLSSVFGPDYFQKQTYLTTGATTFNQTFGNKVWDALNNQKVLWNLLRKVPWGPRAGWVLRTDRGTTATTNRFRPVTETGALPTIDVSAYQGVFTLPKITAASFGVPVRTQFINQLEGGMGDIMAIELEAAERDYLKGVNGCLTAGSAYIASAGDTNTATVPASVAAHFKIGDLIGIRDATDASYNEGTTQLVSAVNTSTGDVDVAAVFAGAINCDDGDMIYILERAGMTSIDDIVMADGVAVGGAGANVNVYNLTTRTSGGALAGLSSYNSGAGRDLTLSLLDARIRAVRAAGGTPNLIVTGYDQYERLNQLLQSQQRFVEYSDYQVGVGDERTLPGTQTGLQVATYRGIPVFPDPDISTSVASDDTVLGSKLYVLDTNHLEIAVAMTPQYVENRNFFDANALVVRGLFFSLMDLRATRLDVQSVLGDLNE